MVTTLGTHARGHPRSLPSTAQMGTSLLVPEREASCPQSSLAKPALSAFSGALDPAATGDCRAGTNRVPACVHCSGFGGASWAASDDSSAWNRLGRLTGGQGVGGSNPLAPTILSARQPPGAIRHSGTRQTALGLPIGPATNGWVRNGYWLHALQCGAAQASRPKGTETAPTGAADCPRVKWADPASA